MSFLKGHKINLGRKRTSEERLKISLSLKGKKHNQKTKEKISKALRGRMPPNIDLIKGWFLGKKLSESHIKNLSESHKGQKSWNKGLHYKRKPTNEETKRKISEAHKKSGHRPIYCERKGKKSHAWKGGRTKKHSIIRMSKKYRMWRKKIFERDNYTCQICFKKGGVLQVDHIKPFAFFPKLRLKDSNARVLCIVCHRKTKTYAKNKFFNV